MNIKSEKNVDWLLICQHCRLEKCREAGMKDDYVHNLRLHVSTIRVACNVFRFMTRLNSEKFQSFNVEA